jgi:hypothetical protein
LAPLDAEYVMDAYKVGKLLSDAEIMLIAQKGFLKVRSASISLAQGWTRVMSSGFDCRSLPADFLTVDEETMKYYLRKVDKCSLE